MVNELIDFILFLPGSEPLSVHEGNGVLCLHLLQEGDEPVALGLQGLGVTDHTAVTEHMITLFRNY